MGTLKYLKQELAFKMGDWQQLTTEDKETLKRWAAEEMAVRGIENTDA